MKKILYVVLVVLLVTVGIETYFLVKPQTKSSYTGEIVGITNTQIYHRDNCQFVKSNPNLIFFKDLNDTVEKFYSPCKTCNPPDNKKEIQLKINELKESIDAYKNDRYIPNPTGRKAVRSTSDSKKYQIDFMEEKIKKLEEILNR